MQGCLMGAYYGARWRKRDGGAYRDSAGEICAAQHAISDQPEGATAETLSFLPCRMDPAFYIIIFRSAVTYICMSGIQWTLLHNCEDCRQYTALFT